MFTGIVETAGEVVGVEADAGGRRLRIEATGLADLHAGQSISVSGVCLTVEAYGDAADGGETADGGRASTD
ncbi:MAG: riboflavin synthase, partial [Natrialbaceae archaeon]